MSDPNNTTTGGGSQPSSDSREADKSTTKCLAAKNKGVIVYCEHDKKLRKFDHPSGELDVVQTNEFDEVTIFSKDADSPSQLDVYRDGTQIDSITGKSKSGGKEYKLKATYCPGSNPYSEGDTILNKVLTFRCPPTEYTIQGLAAPITVKAFNPDQWLFSLSLPPFQKTKMGRVLDNRTSTTVSTQGNTQVTKKDIKKTFEVEEKQHWLTKSSSDTVEKSYTQYIDKYNVKKKMWKLDQKGTQKTDIESEPGEEEKPPTLGGEILNSVKFKRNGTQLKCDALDLIMAALALAKSICDMVKNFDNLVPKIGWYIDFELQILVGSFQLGWGWREVPSTWQTFYYFGIGVKATILDISLEAGFGVQVGGGGVDVFKAQICFGMKGSIEVTFAQTETTGPTEPKLPLKEDPKHQETPGVKFIIGQLGGTITGGLYARVTIGYFLNMEGSATTGIKCDAGVSLEADWTLKLEGNATWSGVTVKYEQSSGLFGGTTKTITKEVVKESKMTEFEFPKKPETKEEMGAYDVQNEITAKLQEGGWWGGATFKKDGDDYATDDAAELITNKIMEEKKKLLLDQKTVEGISHSVRKKLDILGHRDWGWDYVDFDDLVGYLNGAEFTQVLEDAEDPVKQRLLQ